MFFVRRMLTCLTDKMDISQGVFVYDMTTIQLGETQIQAVLLWLAMDI